MSVNNKKNTKKNRKHIGKLLLVFLLTVATVISVASQFMTTVNAYEPVLTCTKEEHTHTDECYTDGELTCDKEEHTHDDTCYIDYSTSETKDVWEARLSSIALDGDNVTNLLNVANAFIGYQEDTTHYILDGETHKNYSIFGAWNGMYQSDNYSNNLTDYSFQDWNSTFIAFVLNYSSNYDYLTSLNKHFNTTEELFNQLVANNTWSTDSQYALAGNIAIYSSNNTLMAGIIKSVDVANSTARLIVGDVTNAFGTQDVEEKTLGLSEIAGYGTGLATLPVVGETPTPTQETTNEEPVATEAPANNSEEPTQESEDTTTYTTEVSDLQNEINALPTVEEYEAMAEGEIVEGTTVTQAQLDVYNKQSELWDTYYNLQDAGIDLSTLDTTKLEALSNYFNGEVDYTDDTTAYDERITVNVSAPKATGEIGTDLKITVVTQTNDPNAQDLSESPVQVWLSELPEGVQITGFVNNKRTIHISGDSPQDIEVVLKYSDGKYYIEYTAPVAGNTLSFDITFHAKNGTMPDGTETSQTTLSETITATPTIVNKKDKDVIGEPATITFTGKNEWKDLYKGENKTTFGYVDGKFEGSIEYTINAKHLNGNSSGELWTDYVYLTDTLTLPSSITFPSGVKKSSDGKSIVTADGTTVFSLSDYQGTGQDWSFEDVSVNGNTLTYKVKVSNTNKENGNLTGEMDHINLKANLNLEVLVPGELYNDPKTNKDIIAKEFITNKIHMDSYVEKLGTEHEDATYCDEKTVQANPNANSRSSIEKKADKSKYQPGDVVTYTITIHNTGSTSIKDKNVVDLLPDYIYLTDEQKKEIQTNYPGTTFTTENGRTKITIPVAELTAYEWKTFTIPTTLSNDLDKYKDSEGNYVFPLSLTNTASYDDNESSTVIVVEEPSTDVEKGKDSIIRDGKLIPQEEWGKGVKDGDIIVYKVTVTNPNGIKSLPQTITDNIPAGLTFKAVYKNSDDARASKGAVATADTTSTTYNIKTTKNNDKTVTFTKENTTIKFGLGELEAYDSVVLYYACEVHTGNTDIKIIHNEASSDHGGKGGEDTPVASQITFDKSVYEADTEGNPSAEGKSYDNLTKFLYKISITNDKDNPNTDAFNELKDTMPIGMYPLNASDDSRGYKIYTSSKSWDYTATYTDSDFTEVQGLTFETYLNDSATYYDGWKDGQQYYYYTKINDEWVKLGRTTTWVGEANANVPHLVLQWSISKLDPGETRTKSYYAQMKMRDYQEKSETEVEFTNTAEFKKLVDHTTVYGKNTRIVILKQVDGNYSTDTLTDEQKEAIRFKITKLKVVDGTQVQDDSFTPVEISLKDFATVSDDTTKLKYTLSKLAYGTYQIEETSNTLGGITPTIRINGVESKDGKITFELSNEAGKNTIEVLYRNTYGYSANVDIQKSVWTINGSESNTFSRESSKLTFKKQTSNGTKYVVYNITIANTGTDPIELDELIDTMDPSLTYVGIAPTMNQADNGDWQSYSDSIETSQWGNGVQYKVDGQDVRSNNVGGVIVQKKRVDAENHTVTFEIQKNRNDENFILNPGKHITFFVKCSISKDAVLNKNINNKASLVVDENVGYKAVGNITMAETKDDDYQNNGDTYEEGSYGEGKKLISSDVDIVPIDGIVPGISKSATQALTPAGSSAEDGFTVTNFSTTSKSKQTSPNAIVKWEITLYNDGTQPITSYTVKDSIPLYWELMTKEEMAKVTKDKDGNALSLKYTIKIGSGSEIDITDEIVKNIKKDETSSSFSIDLKGDTYTIPAGQKAVVTVYTTGYGKTEEYTSYTNTAQFLPTDNTEIYYTKVQHGEIIKDKDGKDIGVQDTDTVFAQGEYGSFSWKSIQDATDESDIAYGYNTTNNYIYVDYDGEEGNRNVIYTNNIENVSLNNYSNLVVTDMMPYVGDTGVVNQDARGSEFAVKFTNSLVVTIRSTQENTIPRVIDASQYKVQYSSKTSFEQGDIEGTSDDNWHDEYQSSDKVFRVVLNPNVILASNEILSIQYNGEVSEDAKPGQIAWNNFAYSYKCLTLTLHAEPPKVGVKIKSAPYITKIVINDQGEDQGVDKSKVFEFTIEGIFGQDTTSSTKTFHLYQGESIKLTHLKDVNGNAISLVEGNTYTVKENTDFNKTYSYVTSGTHSDKTGTQLNENNAVTFTYSSDMDNIQIIFKNKSKSYILPSTGGTGVGIYVSLGGLLMSIAILGALNKKLRDLLS